MTRAYVGLALAVLIGGLCSFVLPGWVAVVVTGALGTATLATMPQPEPPGPDPSSDLEALASTARAFGLGDRFARSSLPKSSPVAELGQAFDAMAERIAAMMEAREELLAAVAHELRTPLNRLRFGIEMVSTIDDPAKRDERAQKLQGDIEELDDLVRELLTWGRLDSVRGVLTKERIDLVALAERLGDDARALGAREVRVEVAEGLRHRAEPRLIRRAWRNGVTNAVRYGAGTVVIGARTDDDGLHLWVDDDGPGVPEDRRASVFEPFVRLDSSRSSSTGGTGLGLALVARIASAHDGVAMMEESPLGGARLHIRI